MRIVHLTNVIAPDKLGGLERYVRELCAEQALRGNDVVVLSKRTSSLQPALELGDDGVRIRRHDSPSKSRAAFAIRYPIEVVAGMRRLLQAEASRADLRARRVVIHAHFPVPALALVLLRIPYIYTFHAPVYREIAGERQDSYKLSALFEHVAIQGMKFVESLVLRHATRVLTLSKFTSHEARLLGVDDRRLSVIAGGLDTSRFVAGSCSAVVSHLAKHGCLNVFTARRLVERTGVEELVRAVGLLHEDFPDLKLRIAGAGPREAAIRNLISELDLTACVKLLGRVSDEQLVQEYRRADLTVTPTQYLEGFGLSTAESLAAGTPAMVTPVGANPELVEGLTPYLVTDDASAAAISKGLRHFLREPGDLLAARQRLAAGFADKWGWEAVVPQIFESYRAFRS